MADYSTSGGPPGFTGAAFTLMSGIAQGAVTSANSAITALTTAANFSVSLSPPSISTGSLPGPGSGPSFSGAEPSIGEGPYVPIIQTYSMPSVPSYVLPTIPTLHDFTIPDFVDGTIHPITTTLPSINFVVPDIGAITADEVVQDSLFGTVRDRLESNILNGGTMLNPVVEADIWNRDLERNEQALQDSVDKVTAQWAKLGFSLPDGLLAGNLLAVNNEYMNKRLDRSREIAVKQAELEQTGIFKSLELGVKFEDIVMVSLNEFARRRLEAEKANGDILLAVFKERVNLYNSNLEAFKADALVYKTSIEAELERAEVYKAKLSALQTLVQVDESKVKIYTSQIAAVEQLVNMYNTEVKAVATMYEAERVKVELFKGQVEAYAAKIDAQMKGFVGRVEAFRGMVEGYAAGQRVTIANAETVSRVAVAQYEANVKLLEATARVAEVGAQVRIEGLKGAAQAASNLAAGAMSAIHASINDSYQESYSFSY